MIVLNLPDSVAVTVETMAAKVGMTSSSWLSDQICHAYGSGRVTLTTPEKPRLSRSTRRRHAAARRAARAARAVTATETTIDE